jgi:hypothetical protein
MNAPANKILSLEPRPLYGIGTIARLTGLKPDTLRVWERRYGLGASYKSTTGRRQYTQSDLEHLQLIAALVHDGARIGEISQAPRKTLEIMLKARGGHADRRLPSPKPKALFIGTGLCGWLDAHQGCISSVNAMLMRSDIDSGAVAVTDGQQFDVLVVECSSLSPSRVAAIEALKETQEGCKVIVCYRLGNDKWRKELEARGMQAVEFPPNPTQFAFELAQCAVRQETEQGSYDLGQLVETKAPIFSDDELRAAHILKTHINCECPPHLAQLITALKEFEQYSTECSIENWQDAAVHASIYAYTAQARHLMERALQHVVNQYRDEFDSLLTDR